jgi:hypothetical protein
MEEARTIGRARLSQQCLCLRVREKLDVPREVTRNVVQVARKTFDLSRSELSVGLGSSLNHVQTL